MKDIIGLETAKVIEFSPYCESGKVYIKGKLRKRPTSHLGSLKENYPDILGAPSIAEVIDFLWEKYSIFVSVIPVKRKGERQIYFQYRITDFRGSHEEMSIEMEVLFEHQYGSSYEEFTTPQKAYNAALSVLGEKLDFKY